MNELFIVNSTIHDHNTRQRNLIHTNRDIQIFPIDLLIMLVHVYGTFLLNKINVNVPISQFKTKKKHEISTRSLTCYRVPKVVLISKYSLI